MRWKLVGLTVLVLLALLLCARRASLFAQDSPAAPRGYFYPAEGSQEPLSVGQPFNPTVEAGTAEIQEPNPGQTNNFLGTLVRTRPERTDRAARLVAELRNNPDPTKEAELRKIVEQEFDERHEAQTREAQALAERLARLQERLKKRQGNKAEIVSRRIKHLLGQPDDLDWEVTQPDALRPGFGGSRNLFQRNPGADSLSPGPVRGREPRIGVADPAGAPTTALPAPGAGTSLPPGEAAAPANELRP